MNTTEQLRAGFAYGTTEAATLLGKSAGQVRRMAAAGELWSFRTGRGHHYCIALDIEGTERLTGLGATAKSNRARDCAQV